VRSGEKGVYTIQQSSSKRPENIQLAWWNPAPYQPLSCLPRRLSAVG